MLKKKYSKQKSFLILFFQKNNFSIFFPVKIFPRKNFPENYSMGFFFLNFLFPTFTANK